MNTHHRTANENVKQPTIYEPDYDDGRIAIIRSFERDIASRIECLKTPLDVSSLGEVAYGSHRYPLYEITAIHDANNPYIRLTGLVHGDEEAGGKALLDFLDDGIKQYLTHFNFIINPCINPSGYETATLQAMNGYHLASRTDKNTGNINRSFNGALPQQESRLIEASLKRGPERDLPPIKWTPVYS
ncbi:hypothetical protein GCM10023116_11230 [Kistimonas scapharcae]|uniref:Peptidase M14 domain-containing protein n=2 Tax=Kistimonas scapharcae TaxID=1036133 RepID=A0ABP8UYM3_9GAMM